MRVCCGFLILLVAGSAVRAEEEPARVRLEAHGTLSAGSDRVRSLAWSLDGTRLAVGSDDRTMRFYDMRSYDMRTFKPGKAEPAASNTLPRYG